MRKRFEDLAVDDQFEYRGQTWVKTEQAGLGSFLKTNAKLAEPIPGGGNKNYWYVPHDTDVEVN